jgi:hypothetical protein
MNGIDIAFTFINKFIKYVKIILERATWIVSEWIIVYFKIIDDWGIPAVYIVDKDFK